jgi:hypothetical protein
MARGGRQPGRILTVAKPDDALVDQAWEPLGPTAVKDRLQGVSDAPWWLAGGYALELFAGRTWRSHDDIDVLVLRRHQRAIHRWLRGWQLYAADPPGYLRPWRPGEWLPPQVHDVWCRETGDSPWRIQFMLDEAEDDQWVSRRSSRVTRPVESLGLTSADGIPYLAPEIQLFYKAKSARPKDELDFDTVAPLLDAAQRDWLKDALNATHRGHPWTSRLPN